ncbi:MAG: T9SS type A sorting domain-containing protein [Saprospirales bacterium]|nr:T9SS type A sorting domain-containing protein [Saprospirales bacterium]
MYPNPSNGIVNISVKLDKNIDNYSMVIYNLQGQAVYSKIENKQLLIGENIISKIDLNNEINGVYFIRILNRNELLFQRTFVLQK